MAPFGLCSQMQSQPDRYLNTNPESFFLATHGYPPILLQLLQISDNAVPLTKPHAISKLNSLCRITEIQPPHLFLVGSQHIPCDRSRWIHLSHSSDTPHETSQPNSGSGGSIWVKNSAAKLIWDVCLLRKKGTQEQNHKSVYFMIMRPPPSLEGIFKEFIST